MDPFSAITGTWQSLKIASGIGKSLIDAKVEGEIKEKVIAINDALLETQQRMFDVQASHAEMVEKLRTLQAQLLTLQSWSQEKERYQLHRTDAGGFLYRLKPTETGTEPEHDICAQCYENNIKSILQSAPMANWYQVLVCHRCNSSVQIKRVPAPSTTARRVSRVIR